MTTPHGGPMLPLSIKVELLVNNAWADISKYVEQRDGIIITGGRAAASDQPSPAQATLTLKNFDGRFTPNYASGAYWPYLTRDQQIRISVTAFSSTGNYYSGYRFWGEIRDWPPLSSVDGRDIYVMLQVTGPLRRLSVGGGWGSALTRYYSTLTGSQAPIAYWPCEEDPQTTQLQPGLAGGQVMNITSGTPTWKADKTLNGSGPVGYLNGSTWDGLTGSFGGSGDDSYSSPGTYSWLAGVSSVNVKCTAGGGGGGGGDGESGGGGGGGGGERAQNTTVAVTPGNFYTVVVGAGGRGNMSDYSGANGGDSTFTGDSTTVHAHGGQGGIGQAFGGAGGAGGTGSTDPVHHNGGNGNAQVGSGGGGGGSGGDSAAGNNGSGSTGGAAVTGGGKGGNGGTSVPYDGQQGGAPGGGGGGTGPSVTAVGGNGQGGKVELIYTPASAPPANVLRAAVVVPKHGGNNGKVLLRMLTSGTIARLDVQYSKASGGSINVFGYNSGLTQLFTSGAVALGMNGKGLLISVELTNSGSSVAYTVTGINPGANSRTVQATGTVASASVGNVSEVLAGPNGDITNTAIGHISVQYAVIPIEQVADSLNGHVSEMTVDRLIRLAAEEALDSEPVFAEGSDHWGFEHGTQGWTATNATQAISDVWSSGNDTVFVQALPAGAHLDPGPMGYSSAASAIAAWQAWTGQPLHVLREYAAVSDFTFYQKYRDETAAGQRLSLDLRPAVTPSATDLANMATLLQQMKAAGIQAEISLWATPVFNGLTSAQFITMFQYYAPTVQQYYPTAFVTDLSSVVNSSENTYYPGDAYVDVVGSGLLAGDFLSSGYSFDSAATVADTAVPRKKFSIHFARGPLAQGNFLWQPQSGFEVGGAGGASNGGVGSFISVAAQNGNAGTASATLACPVLNSGPALGTTVIGVIKGSSSDAVTGVADSQGNTWVIDTAISAIGPTIAIVRAVITHPLTSADTITITYAGANNDNGAIFSTYGGALYPDKTYNTDWSAATGATVTSSAATSYAGDLVVMGVTTGGVSDQTFTWSATTPAVTVRGTNGTTPHVCSMADGIATAASTTPGFTIAYTASQIGCAAIGMYSSASAGTWTGAGNCSVAPVCSQAHSGSGALALVSGAAGNMAAASCLAANILTQGLPVNVGDTVTCQLQVKAATIARTVEASVDWYTSAGAFISTGLGTGVSDSTSGWTLATASVVAPATAAFCRASVQVLSTGAANEVHWIDDVLLYDNAQGFSSTQWRQFLAYLQTYIGTRYAEGKLLGDLLYDNGFANQNQTTIIQSAADPRLPYIADLATATPLPASGNGHVLMLTSAGGAGQWYSSSPTGTSGQPVNNGDVVSAAADVYANGTTIAQAFLNIDWYNSGGTYLSTTSGVNQSVTAGTSATLKVTGNAPSGAAFFRVSCGDNATVGAGVMMAIDNVRVGARMGSQERKALREFIDDIHDLEQGLYADSKKLLGLKFRTRISLINQVPALVLDYSKGQVANDYQQGAAASTGGGPVAPLAPVFDDLLTVTEVDIRRHKGSRITLIGIPITLPVLTTAKYRKFLRVLAEKDTQLLALAQHLLNLGNWQGERYPTVAVNMLRASLAGNSMGRLMSAAAGVEIGDYIQITNLPFYFPGPTAKQMVIGYTEYINAYEWSITWNCAPESPFEIVSTSLRRW